MLLPESWVDALFAKLSMRYGVAFMRQWPDADPAIIKADWAEVLGGFKQHPECIKHALDNLPTDKPPTALQFRAMCRAAPTDEENVPRLEWSRAPVHPAVVQKLAEVAQAKKAAQGNMSDAQYCAARIREIAAARGGVLTADQRRVLNCCESNGPEAGDVLAGFTPIPVDVLPPAMRAAA